MNDTKRFPTNSGVAAVMALLFTQVLAQDTPPEQEPNPATSSFEQLAQTGSFDAIGDRLAERLPLMADKMFQSMGSQTIQTLIDSGLSQADSEAIARRYASDFADCGRSAFMLEAERQGISINELLARLMEVTYIGNVDLSEGSGFDPVQNVSKVMDVYGMNANLLACVTGAMQAAGIPFEAGLEALPQTDGIDSQ